MKQELSQKVALYIEARNMISRGDKVVAGISGGADSICLLFLLCEIRKTTGIEIRVVHVDHGIREEAADDAEYVRDCCERWGVPFRLVRVDVPEMAAKWGMSEEEAGRRVRYEAFEKEADDWAEASGGIIKIAVAHNMNDNAETILFRLFRGTGLKGMTGIPYSRKTDRGYDVIRPLLVIQRSEIEEFLEDKGIRWVSDATNNEDVYSRNRIRHRIIPEAEDISRGAVKHINETALMLTETEDLLRELEKECLKECRMEDPAREDETVTAVIGLRIDKLEKYHIAVVKRVILACLSEVTGGGKDVGSLQTEQILDLMAKSENRKIDLARGVSAFREYDSIFICAGSSGADPGTGYGELWNGHLKTEVYTLQEIIAKTPEFMENLHREGISNEYTKWVDYDKIDGQIEIRTRKTGDHFLTRKADGFYGRKTLKEYMIDRKIPSRLRDSIPVIANGSKCIWLVGYRLSDDVMITDKTKKVMKLEWVGEREK